jgi:hypothetical protein
MKRIERNAGQREREREGERERERESSYLVVIRKRIHHCFCLEPKYNSFVRL